MALAVQNSFLETPQSRATRLNRAITFNVFQNDQLASSYTINLMPETYSVDEPTRVTVTQTRGSAWIDDFGPGIGTLTMSGTTGWGARRNINKGKGAADVVDGFQRWVGLRDFFKDFFDNVQGDPNSRWTMQFYNWTQEDYYQVYPMGLPQLQRNVQQSLLFRYTIQLHLLARAESSGYKTTPDFLDDLALAVQRAPVVGAQMTTKLETQWEALKTSIENVQTLPDISDLTIVNFTPGQDLVVKDAEVQAYIDGVMERQAPGSYTAPTDSALGVVGRTRTLAGQITDYANGKTAFIGSTLAEVRATAQGWRDTLDALEYAANIPADYIKEVRETLCSVQSMLLYPQLFRSSVSATLTELSNLIQDSGCATTLQF